MLLAMNIFGVCAGENQKQRKEEQHDVNKHPPLLLGSGTHSRARGMLAQVERTLILECTSE